MSGFDKNSWDRYLNGGTSSYNFKYKGDEPPPMINPVIPVIPVPNIKQVETHNIKVPKRSNQTGGKRRRNLKKKTMKKSYKK
jgi:hypothetical protein